MQKVRWVLLCHRRANAVEQSAWTASGNQTSPPDNSNDRWKRLCFISWGAASCVWTLRALTRNLLTYLLINTDNMCVCAEIGLTRQLKHMLHAWPLTCSKGHYPKHSSGLECGSAKDKVNRQCHFLDRKNLWKRQHTENSRERSSNSWPKE